MLFKIAFFRLLKGDAKVPEPLLPSSTYHVVKSELLLSFSKTILSSKYVPGDLKLILNLPCYGSRRSKHSGIRDHYLHLNIKRMGNFGAMTKLLCWQVELVMGKKNMH